MSTHQPAPNSIDAYIVACPPDVQAILEQIRLTIRETVLDAEETMSYQMPTFTLNGQYLVYFAAFKEHIGLYPAPTRVEEFQDELSVYGAGKGTLKFPLDQPIPFDLIRRFVAFRAKEILERANTKGKKQQRT